MAPFVGFIGETYTGRAPAADAERSQNLFLEKIESPTGQGKAEWILLSRPGLKTFATLTAPTPPPVPHGVIVSAVLKGLTTHIPGGGYSANGVWTTSLAWGAGPLTFGIPFSMYDPSAWTNRTDSVTLTSPTSSSVYNTVSSYYLENTILGHANPPDELDLYEVWIEASYSDGSTWRMTPTQYQVTGVGNTGAVANPANAMDANNSTFTAITGADFGPFNGVSVAIQYTGFVASTLITPGSTPPQISSFVATPKAVAGTSPTLSWVVSGATTVSIDNGVGSVTPTSGGSVTVNPTATTTYTLTATNAAGMSVTSQATVTVIPVPVIASFTATPGSVTLGSSSTLAWSITGATSISLDNGIGTVTGTSLAVSPSVTTTYTLTATNAGGSSTQTVTVIVQKPTISSFTSSPISITSGGSATLAWTVAGATSLSISPTVGTVTGTSISVSPTTTTTYTLTATNAMGSTTATVTLTVGAAPTPPAIASFSASPASIVSGGSSSLAWSVSGATSLSIDHGVGTVTTSPVSVSPTVTTTYTLTATNAAGSSTATTTVTVTVPAPTISAFTASPSTLTLGSATTLAWTTANATSLSISGGVGTVTGSSISVSPTATTTYTLTASNAAGSTTASVTVNVSKPVISSFTATPASIALGASSTLAWSIAGAASVFIDNGVGTVTGSSLFVTPSTTTTYTLTATNSSGSVTATATVTVTAPPTLSSFTATPGTITTGSSSTLAWAATGSPTFSISPGIGTVTGSSLSVSPAATTTYTITATNSAGSVTKTVTVTVVAAPVISSFTASPTSIAAGASSTLAWTTTGATSLSISGLGTVTGSSTSVSPTATTTYTLSAQNAAGTVVTASVTVTVTSSSLAAQIAADMTTNEEPPQGVPTNYDFFTGSFITDGNNPAGALALEAWGGVYPGNNGGNPATNTRINVRNFQLYWKRASTGVWQTAAGTYLSSNSFDGGYYSQDFTTDYGQTLNFRTESDGTLSFNFAGHSGPSVCHFYAPYPRVSIDPNDFGGVVVAYEARLIVDNPSLPNDTATANIVADAGCDYYPQTSGSGIEQNPGVGGGRFKILQTSWRSVCFTTLTQAQLAAAPPPISLAGATV